MAKEFKCECCGKIFVPLNTDKKNQPKYCSKNCYFDARYGKLIPEGTVPIREPVYLEAVKLCQAGLSQTQAARQLGISFAALNQWLRACGREAIFADRVCVHCGKSMSDLPCLSSRLYCSRTCCSKAQYAREHPNYHPMTRHAQDIRDKALELYWGGLGPASISRYLQVPPGTVDCWIDKFGRTRERRQTSAAMQLRPISQRIKEAETSEEWLRIFREIAGDASNSINTPVYLVCGTICGNVGMNQLVTIIADRLRLDPTSGETFAFCDQQYKTIITINWEGSIVRICKLPKMHGAYLWPRKEFGLFIKVTPHEFECLIFYSKSDRKS